MSDLHIEKVSAAFEGRTVLRGVSLVVPAGEVVGLIGPNGAGKSTLLRVIGGAMAASGGIVRLGDVDLGRLPAIERARQVAVVPQRISLPDGFTVAEVVLMGRTPHLGRFGGERPRDYEAARRAMAVTATSELAERRVGELSGGERQRVLVARALAQEPRLLLLDEATAHLDLRHQLAVLRIARKLARSGLAVLAAMHDVNLAALYADRIALLCEGELLAYDVPEQVLTPDLLRRAYGVATIVGRHPRHGTPTVALVDDD